MEMPHNALKRAIREGKSQIGLWSSLSSNYTVEVIAGAGFDWILRAARHERKGQLLKLSLPAAGCSSTVA